MGSQIRIKVSQYLQKKPRKNEIPRHQITGYRNDNEKTKFGFMGKCKKDNDIDMVTPL